MGQSTVAIDDHMFVTLSYDLYVENPEGPDSPEELMESTPADRPLEFVFGTGMMLPKFEDALRGLAEGDAFDFRIDHADAYGEYDDELLARLEKSVFYVDGRFDDQYIREGAVVPLMNADGETFHASVVEVTDTHVLCDLNHPLAGENLHFTGKILSVRPATSDEVYAATHPHHGCGCSHADGCDHDHAHCSHHHDDDAHGCAHGSCSHDHAEHSHDAHHSHHHHH